MVALLLASPFLGFTEEEEAPCCGTEQGVDQIVLKGITVVPTQEDLDKVPRRAGVHFFLEKIDASGIKKVLSSYLGDTLSEEEVQKIKNTLIDFFIKKQIYVTVVVPEQEVTDGILIFEILISRVGDMTFEGQQWFAPFSIERNITIKKGEMLDQNRLLNDLAFLNTNPSRRTDAFLSPGDEPGTTDIEFLTKDKFPLHFYAGGDSTGIQTVDRIRVFGGLRWDDAFHIGDVLSYQYTASPDFHEFQSHVATYISSLPTQDRLTILGIYGQVYPVLPGFRTNGQAAQASATYSYLFKPLYRGFKHEVSLGLTYKYLNSNLFFVGTATELPLIQQKINITEIVAGYYLENVDGPHELTMSAQLFGSPWKQLLPDQTNTDYEILRPGSKVRFIYGNINFSYMYQIWRDCLLSIVLNGQGASGALPASEQYSLGGMNSVRGYEQSQFLADNAACSNIELYLPGFSVIPGIQDRANFFCFFDAAYGINYKMDATPSYEHQVLTGVGPGFRYTAPPYFSLTAEYGFRLHRIPGGDAMGRFYLSAVMGY
jgi:hemolysin activation/secretion protein